MNDEAIINLAKIIISATVHPSTGKPIDINNDHQVMEYFFNDLYEWQKKRTKTLAQHDKELEKRDEELREHNIKYQKQIKEIIEQLSKESDKLRRFYLGAFKLNEDMPKLSKMLGLDYDKQLEIKRRLESKPKLKLVEDS